VDECRAVLCPFRAIDVGRQSDAVAHLDGDVALDENRIHATLFHGVSVKCTVDPPDTLLPVTRRSMQPCLGSGRPPFDNGTAATPGSQPTLVAGVIKERLFDQNFDEYPNSRRRMGRISLASSN